MHSVGKKEKEVPVRCYTHGGKHLEACASHSIDYAASIDIEMEEILCLRKRILASFYSERDVCQASSSTEISCFSDFEAPSIVIVHGLS